MTSLTSSDLLASDLILSRANLVEITGDSGIFWGWHAILNKLADLIEPLLFLTTFCYLSSQGLRKLPELHRALTFPGGEHYWYQYCSLDPAHISQTVFWVMVFSSVVEWLFFFGVFWVMVFSSVVEWEGLDDEGGWGEKKWDLGDVVWVGFQHWQGHSSCRWNPEVGSPDWVERMKGWIGSWWGWGRSHLLGC